LFEPRRFVERCSAAQCEASGDSSQ
jgi:hypothetical protein